MGAKPHTDLCWIISHLERDFRPSKRAHLLNFPESSDIRFSLSLSVSAFPVLHSDFCHVTRSIVGAAILSLRLHARTAITAQRTLCFFGDIRFVVLSLHTRPSSLSKRVSTPTRRQYCRERFSEIRLDARVPAVVTSATDKPQCSDGPGRGREKKKRFVRCRIQSVRRVRTERIPADFTRKTFPHVLSALCAEITT